MKSKHQEPTILSHKDYKSPCDMNTPQQTMLHPCCTSKDECGTRGHDITGDQVRCRQLGLEIKTWMKLLQMFLNITC